MRHNRILLQTDMVCQSDAWYVSRSVCLSVGLSRPSVLQKREPVEMPFGMWTRVRPRTRWGSSPDTHTWRSNF